ncbi:iron-containing alcohol dehydrogenase [Malacoplasma penetrans]|nr:iron-containing alcohol dehydrogenase [Malacoplasma penetrans]RXY96100.1 iron-containing alcohol dehydrogenase [Malacoplasma penetrans]
MSSVFLKSKYFFGKGAIFEAKDELASKKYKKALILYGGGSVKTNGSFNDLITLLKEINLRYVEFGGIEPNPKTDTVYKAILFARENKVDVIFAIGGGSVIDSSKVIGALTANPHLNDVWEYCLDTSKLVNPSIDIIAITTLAGTASENNSGSVISNSKTNEKYGVFTPSAVPVCAIEDPTYTFTVNKWQTASGIFDCFSHLTEQYLGTGTFGWTKNYLFANLKTLLKYAKTAVDDPTNYEARSNVLWTTTMALTQLAYFQCESTDWAVHTIEHSFSGRWDITHGAGLAFVTPTYWKLRSEKDSWFKDKIVEFGKEIFGVNGFDATIEYLVNWIKSIYLPTNWSQFSEIKEITEKDIDFLVEHSFKFNFAPHISKDFFRKVITELAKIK